MFDQGCLLAFYFILKFFILFYFIFILFIYFYFLEIVVCIFKINYSNMSMFI